MQEDALVPTATPRESLRFSAVLRLSTEPSVVNELVEEILERLHLNDCANTVIGGHMAMKGISGGERKRTSIGVEIITNPSILLLDEPTSGLDR